jgi:hypothetical protein
MPPMRWSLDGGKTVGTDPERTTPLRMFESGEVFVATSSNQDDPTNLLFHAMFPRVGCQSGSMMELVANKKEESKVVGVLKNS